MFVTKSRAAKLAGISRRTLYNHIPQKKISVVVDDDGNEKIDVSELERVYNKEVIQSNLKALEDAQKDNENDVHISQDNTKTGVKYELPLLKERLKSLEDQKEQMERFHHRERQQAQEEIENLRDSLKKAQDHQSQLSLLLTHQRKDKETMVGEQGNKMQTLETTIEELRKQNRRILHEIKTEKSKGFWQRLFE